MKRYEISDEAWKWLEPLLPAQRSHQKGHSYKNDQCYLFSCAFTELCL